MVSFKLAMVMGSVLGIARGLSAADFTGAQPTNDPAATGAFRRFNVKAYRVEGKPLLPADSLTLIFSRHIGTNISVGEIAAAASDLQAEYRRQGYPDMSVSAAPDRITNGIVKMHVFQGTLPQILISGTRYVAHVSGMMATNWPAAEGGASQGSHPTAIATNAPPATNAVPHITVDAYEVIGNDLLSDEVLQSVLSKYTGTNVSFDDIGNMLKELTLEYRDRGFDTVSVTTPVQTISNAIIKIQIFEGTLASIKITGNHYFSSNNIMRSLPGLKTNMILNSKLFQPELDRANANQDRQIYPQIGEGADPDTSTLTLIVKDRLPLHAKVELNNENSPDTPDLRINSSAVYNNLWQLDHSIGVQYSFSPEIYKQGSQWNFYDLPLVANYSAFYRLPLGNPGSVADAVTANPGSFGYNEATRKFNLPPSSGVPELNAYASRSTIDTGVQDTASEVISSTTNLLVTRFNEQQDLTVNENLGFRLSLPVQEFEQIHSAFSTGLDYKNYEDTTAKSFVFNFIQQIPTGSGITNTVVTQFKSPVPTAEQMLRYLPLSLRYDASLRDALGTTAFGLGLSVNAWYSGTIANLQNISGSTESSGHWVILTPSLSRDFDVYNNWIFSIRADGQWANEPLISNEQFGAGGVASVRGYHEGEIFGDTGWHISVEQKTPPHVIGYVNGNAPLTVRGSIYMDYAETFLLDPQGRPARTPLWGTGFGVVGSVGTHWDARFLFSMPLLNAGTIEAFQPGFIFSLTAQF
jgi:hemolysin activation/secretion protein